MDRETDRETDRGTDRETVTSRLSLKCYELETKNWWVRPSIP